MLPVAFFVVAAACQLSPEETSGVLGDEGRARVTGCNKADAMWRDNVLPTAYDMNDLPSLSGPGISDIITFLSSAFVAKSITNEGDELEEGRRKLVHAWGTLVRVKLEVPATARHPYTGMLASGAPCGIVRFSLATAPTASNSTPAMAIKWFVDGANPSANIQVMNSVDGQDGHNFFEKAFSNIIPDASGFATRLLSHLFHRGAVEAGAEDTSASHLKITPMVTTKADGSAVREANEPRQIWFEPTDYAKSIMDGATLDDDFRAKLAGIEVGKTLYEVYAYASDRAEAEYIGSLVTTSAVVAASYGDEKLFFKHTK